LKSSRCMRPKGRRVWWGKKFRAKSWGSLSLSFLILVFRPPAVSVTVSVAVSIGVVGFALGSFSAFFEELLHSGDFRGVGVFVVSAIGLCLLGGGDGSVDSQTGVLDAFECHHESADFLEVRGGGFVQGVFETVGELFPELIVALEEFVGGFHGGFLSRGWGTGAAGWGRGDGESLFAGGL